MLFSYPQLPIQCPYSTITLFCVSLSPWSYHTQLLSLPIGNPSTPSHRLKVTSSLHSSLYFTLSAKSFRISVSLNRHTLCLPTNFFFLFLTISCKSILQSIACAVAHTLHSQLH